MCGIAGHIRANAPTIDAETAAAVLGSIAHRGPDDEGQWREDGVWLGHRRLSIIDVSPAGRQPMLSHDGRYVIVANGEIYNYKILRAELEAGGGSAWRGHSDIEVLLEAIARFGVEAAIRRALGMFALAVWDRETKTAYLARDRFGEKPLYYSADAIGIAFASELRAFERMPEGRRDVSLSAVSLFLRLGYVPAPYAILDGVKKAPPASIIIWRAGEEAKVTPYWSLAEVARCGERRPLSDQQSAADELDRVLRGVVADQMISDVPLGVFLSGGIDSSLVTAIMQQVGGGKTRTFTLGFDAPQYDEAPYARAVAAHLGTDHTEHTATAADAQAIFPRLGALYDEPFADPSQAPTLLVSEMARRSVTVCLSGDGGDELFAGYVRYPGAPRLWRAMRRFPFRRAAARLIEATPVSVLDRALQPFAPLGAEYAARGKLGAAARRIAAFLPATSFDALYEATMTAWPDPARLLAAGAQGPACWRPERPANLDELRWMQWRDSVDYLPGDILCKVDRAAMAYGLETRAPLLDPRVAEFAWRAPADLKIRKGQTKWLMRHVLSRYLPQDLIERPKLGFSVPLHAWLTGPLREWAESLIAPDRLARQGLLRPAPVAKAWRRYLAGDSSTDQRIWTVLMLQAWIEARP